MVPCLSPPASRLDRAARAAHVLGRRHHGGEDRHGPDHPGWPAGAGRQVRHAAVGRLDHRPDQDPGRPAQEQPEMTGLLVRLVVWALWGIVRLVVAGLVVAARLLLGLLGVAGLRGARLAWLVATVLAVGWAAHVVGLRAAVALAALGWLVWATRHHRAQLRQRAALRKLTRALETHTRALRTAGTRRSPAATVAAKADALASAPRLAAGQSPEQALRVLERYAAAWTRRHTQPITDHDRSAS